MKSKLAVEEFLVEMIKIEIIAHLKNVGSD